MFAFYQSFSWCWTSLFVDCRGLFPEIVVDIVLFDDEDDTDFARLSEQTDPTGQVNPTMGHVLAADDVEDVGKTSTEANNPSPIGAGAPAQPCLLPPIGLQPHLLWVLVGESA
jgi:hypothetical protein